MAFDHDGKPVVVVANAPADADAIVLASTPFDKAKINRHHKTVQEPLDSFNRKHKGAKHASAR